MKKVESGQLGTVKLPILSPKAQARSKKIRESQRIINAAQTMLVNSLPIVTQSYDDLVVSEATTATHITPAPDGYLAYNNHTERFAEGEYFDR